MSSANKIVDDMSRVFAGALGVAQGAKDEAETAMKSFVSKLVDDRNFVSREEFDAVSQMAQNARAEVAQLRAEIDALKAQTKKPARKAPAKAAKRTTKGGA